MKGIAIICMLASSASFVLAIYDGDISEAMGWFTACCWIFIHLLEED
jgi:hypothetical protein